MVYTPVPTVMSCGHFLTYDTMHLTEFTVMSDLGLDQTGEWRPEASNALNQCMLRKVYRMAMALPYHAPTRCMFGTTVHTAGLTASSYIAFHRRCIIGMRSILQLEPQGPEADAEVLRFPGNNSLVHELTCERARAQSILDRIMSHWGITDAYAEMRKGSWMDLGPHVNLEGICMV